MTDIVERARKAALPEANELEDLLYELADEIERLRAELAWNRPKIERLRLAINDVELALSGLEIEDLVDRWEGAKDSVEVKVNLGDLRQLARSYPALNRITNESQ